MTKITLSDVADIRNPSSSTIINANSALIEAEMENTISRDGTSPNMMLSDLDMNSNQIINLPAAGTDTEPVRKAEFDVFVQTMLNFDGIDLPPVAGSLAFGGASVITNEEGMLRTIAGSEGEVLVFHGSSPPTSESISAAVLPSIAANTVLGNPTGSAATPTEISVTAAGRALIDDADATAQRATLGLVIGTNVQAYDDELATWANKVPPSGTSVGHDDTQTLTNKTIALGSNTVSGTLAQFNTAITDADISSSAGTETLSNKTINLSVNTLTGTKAQFNTAMSDADFATLTGSETLTNKTMALGSNTLTGTAAQFNTAVTDDDFASLTGTQTLTNKTISTANNTITIASTTATGVVELATDAETILGTDNSRPMTPSNIGGAWTNWTPTVTASTGTITTVGVVTAKYRQLGKTIQFRVEINITTNGTGAGYLQFTLPAATHGTGRQGFTGAELLAIGKQVYGYTNPNGSTLAMRTYDNLYPGADGAQIAVSGIYEAA